MHNPYEFSDLDETAEEELWPEENTSFREYYADSIRDMYFWQGGAPCFGVSDKIMYDPRQTKQAKVAQDFCKQCPFAHKCLMLALLNREDYGVWGGSTEIERKVLISKINKSAYADFKENFTDMHLKFFSMTAEDFISEKFPNEEVNKEALAEAQV